MAQNCECAVRIGTSAGRDDHAGVSKRHDGVVRVVLQPVCGLRVRWRWPAMDNQIP